MSSAWSHPLMEGLPTLGKDIEALSHKMINEFITDLHITQEDLPVVRRMIHATADAHFGKSVRIHPDALARGIEAIRRKKPIICDVHMVKSGITRTESEVICLIKDEAVIARAKANRTTRAWASMELLSERIDGAVVAIGNAPTALWKILELAATRQIRPAVVVGIPVGFVGAAESKQALLESDLCYITNIGPRGGSPLAAAAVNALAIEAKKTTIT